MHAGVMITRVQSTRPCPIVIPVNGRLHGRAGGQRETCLRLSAIDCIVYAGITGNAGTTHVSDAV